MREKEEIAKIVKVKNKINRNGDLIPIIVVEPVFKKSIDIVFDSYTTVNRRDLRIGDVVVLGLKKQKALKIVKVLVEKRTGAEKEIFSPVVCPECDHVVGGISPVCFNPKCRGRRISVLEDFVSPLFMNIKGISTEKVKALYDLKLVRDPIDFYSLHEKRDVLIVQKRFGEKTADSLFAEIEKTKGCDIITFFKSMLIPNMRSVDARLIVEYVASSNTSSTREEFIYALFSLTHDELERITGFSRRAIAYYLLYVNSRRFHYMNFAKVVAPKIEGAKCNI